MFESVDNDGRTTDHWLKGHAAMPSKVFGISSVRDGFILTDFLNFKKILNMSICPKVYFCSCSCIYTIRVTHIKKSNGNSYFRQ